MATSILGKTQGWFSIDEDLSQSITANTLSPCNDKIAVAFDKDVTLTLGTMSFGFELAAYTPLALDDKTVTLSINVDANMFAMGH